MSLPVKPTYKEALKFWFKLGWISFGGPAGQIAILHEFIVEKKKWISEKKFLHALNYCMLLPGPEAQQLATYTGWLLHGTRGGLTAGILFILPSIFILLGLSIVYVEYGNLPWIYALFEGLKPAVVAIVIVAMIKIAKRSLATPLHVAIALLSFIAIFFFDIPFPVIILTTLLIAFILRFATPKIFNSRQSNSQKNDDESGYYLTTTSVIPGTGFKLSRFMSQIAIFIFLWSIPMILFYSFSSDFNFWKNLSLFFTQAAFVTFGGAYAVLPYVAQKAVESFHWLSSLQMIDGLALGESTPGPLIMVLAFVGFMGGYNYFGSSLMTGTIGLLTTTYFTFLPCFLFIFAGAPLIEKTQQNNSVKTILSFVTAAVTGVVLNLTLYFGEAVIFAKNHARFSDIDFNELNYINLGWIIISFVALYRFKIDMMIWIGISALFGLINYLV
ncbi:MAG: chromate efflux transporter [Chitinophagales bacterium]